MSVDGRFEYRDAGGVPSVEPFTFVLVRHGDTWNIVTARVARTR